MLKISRENPHWEEAVLADSLREQFQNGDERTDECGATIKRSSALSSSFFFSILQRGAAAAARLSKELCLVDARLRYRVAAA